MNIENNEELIKKIINKPKEIAYLIAKKYRFIDSVPEYILNKKEVILELSNLLIPAGTRSQVIKKINSVDLALIIKLNRDDYCFLKEEIQLDVKVIDYYINAGFNFNPNRKIFNKEVKFSVSKLASLMSHLSNIDYMEDRVWTDEELIDIITSLKTKNKYLEIQIIQQYPQLYLKENLISILDKRPQLLDIFKDIDYDIFDKYFNILIKQKAFADKNILFNFDNYYKIMDVKCARKLVKINPKIFNKLRLEQEQDLTVLSNIIKSDFFNKEEYYSQELFQFKEKFYSKIAELLLREKIDPFKLIQKIKDYLSDDIKGILLCSQKFVIELEKCGIDPFDENQKIGNIVRELELMKAIDKSSKVDTLINNKRKL